MCGGSGGAARGENKASLRCAHDRQTRRCRKSPDRLSDVAPRPSVPAVVSQVKCAHPRVRLPRPTAVRAARAAIPVANGAAAGTVAAGTVAALRLSGHRPAKMLSTARPRRYWRSGAHWVTPFLRSHVAPRPAVAAVVRTVQSSRRCRGRPPCAPRERRPQLPAVRRPPRLPRATSVKTSPRRIRIGHGSRPSFAGFLAGRRSCRTRDSGPVCTRTRQYWHASHAEAQRCRGARRSWRASGAGCLRFASRPPCSRGRGRRAHDAVLARLPRPAAVRAARAAVGPAATARRSPRLAQATRQSRGLPASGAQDLAHAKPPSGGGPSSQECGFRHGLRGRRLGSSAAA